ncbi:MAG: NAD-dependent epimerase/dehydratase family protein, partial [Alphaproteobacteria bacterium]
ALRMGMGRSAGLFACPSWLLAFAARLSGQADRWKTVGGNLVASSQSLQSTGWRASESMEELPRQVGRNG